MWDEGRVARRAPVSGLSCWRSKEGGGVDLESPRSGPLEDEATCWEVASRSNWWG